jgi:hypothetical protein
MARGFQESCVSDEMNGKEDNEEVGNVSSESGTHDVNCEGTEAGTSDRVRLVKVNED